MMARNGAAVPVSLLTGTGAQSLCPEIAAVPRHLRLTPPAGRFRRSLRTVRGIYRNAAWPT